MNINTEVKDFILSHLTISSDRKIGIEIENIIYTNEGQRIKVNPGDVFSATDLLNVVKNKKENNENYSLEPGGQLEWASPPFKNLNNLENSIKNQIKQLKNILYQNNLQLIPYGLDPHLTPKDVGLINQKRYKIMDKNMLEVDKMGQWMMRCTSSIQVNFDVSSEKDMEEMVFIADCLHPIASYLFSNSPYKNNEPAKYKNLRNIIWSNTDNSRCNNLFDHGIYSKNDLIDKYINYIFDVPAIFSLNNQGEAVEAKNTIGSLLTQMKENGILNKEYILCFLRQVFTNVRIKGLVEIRGADRTPEGFEIVPAAFWTGLLIEDSIRENVLALISSWSKEDRALLNTAGLSLNINQIGPKKKTYGEWIECFSELALEGLKGRQYGEEHLLENYLNIVKEKGPFTLQRQKDG